MSRFLHDFAKFSRERHGAATLYQRRFDLQYFAPDFCPGQSRRQTDLALVVNLLGAEFGFAEELSGAA